MDRTHDELAGQAIELAATLLKTATAQQTRAEKAAAEQIGGMMEDPDGKSFTIALSDQAFRSHNPARIAKQIDYLLTKFGAPSYMKSWEQLALKAGAFFGKLVPSLVVPFIVAKLRSETSAVILPGEEAPLRTYIQARRAKGTRLNLNSLGEAILGETEAQKKFGEYLDLLERPDVEYISVKISSVFSQINLIAFDQTVEKIKDRLRPLYQSAQTHQFVRADGVSVPKFVNLDMEEYRDLHLTVVAFKELLEEPEFHKLRAGIVLQGYLPDSYNVQKQLTEWAKVRVGNGGAPIKIRIVKGANLAMEKVEAALHDWEQAPYATKADVDANYKRMVNFGCVPENAAAVNLGIASHNLFDIAYALLLREKHGVEPCVELEMLEGMANHQARAVQEKAGGLLLYAPVVKKQDFHSAIAYLVRRLDENTAPENFLHDLFGLEVGSQSWEKQKGLFLSAVSHQHTVSAEPRRQQNRHTETFEFAPDIPFHNEADTDWALPQNQRWAADIMDKWRDMSIEPIPLQINGEFIQGQQTGRDSDPSRPDTVAYTYAHATPAQIDRALATAKASETSWSATPIADRKALLLACATKLAERRADFIGAAIIDAGKAIPQADVEVSEAIDFASYYARAFDGLDDVMATAEFTPFGTVLITPPWNFPIAISIGGMLSALMAGNCVIMKPAPETVLVGWMLCNALWDAGIPHDVLQFVPTTDDKVGQGLVTDERVNAVILTGGYETARLFLGWKPRMRLLAETSGKNAIIVSALADYDQVVKDLVYAAFGHNGQKCSASSLAVLEAEVYDNPAFMRQLKDAAASIKVGSAYDLESIVTPLVQVPNDNLCRAQTTLEAGESWLLKPEMIDGNPNLWSPGIKLGVKRNSFYHRTECFGPVLGLMRANDLADAIEIVNDSEFALTSGLYSLDEREVAIWKEMIEAGNAYVNRPITGAIVQRQPFGGWKRSAFGSGAKAGGVNYVLSLGTWTNKTSSDYKSSYELAWHNHFSLEHDPSEIFGETNVFRYRPISSLLLRVDTHTPQTDIDKVTYAASLCGVPVTVSHVDKESEAELGKRLGDFERMRLLAPASDDLFSAAHEVHCMVTRDGVVDNGRLELRHYLREQAVTETVHRYGSILERS